MKPKSHVKTLTFILKLGFVVLCLWYFVHVIRKVGPEQVWTAARTADVQLFLVAAVAFLAYFLIWTWKWRIVIQRGFPISFSFVWKLVMAGSFINLVTPTAKIGGGIWRGFAIRRVYGRTLAESYGWVLADQLASGFGKGLLLGGLAIIAALTPAFETWRIPLLITGVIFVVLPCAWPWLRAPLWRQLQKGAASQWLTKLTPPPMRSSGDEHWIAEAFSPLLKLGRVRDIWRVDLGLAALSFAVFCLANALVLRAMGADDTSLMALSFAIVLGYMAGGALGVMGGIGVTEVFLFELYGQIGVSDEIAVAGAVLQRALYYVIQITFGGWALWRATRQTPVSSKAVA